MTEDDFERMQRRLARDLPATEESHRAGRAAELLEACARGLKPLRGSVDVDQMELMLAAMSGKLRERADERVEVVLSLVWAPTSGTCRVCGCMDDAACEGGCGWANPEHTLCTRCA